MVVSRTFRAVLFFTFLVVGFSAYSAHACCIGIVPDPSPSPLIPVIIIPGLLESHNANRILYDKDGGTWKFTPSVAKFFNPLIQRLEAEGYEQGVTLFIAYNDWRVSSNDSARGYLKPVIDNAKAISGSEKVHLVAHSMGGLLARAYIQGDSYENDVDQLVMLGTPNAGSASAYGVWEGGKFPVNWNILQHQWVRRIESSLKKIRHQDLTRPESYRTFFPSIKELLPIDSYVIRGGNNLMPSDLKEQNTFLENLRTTSHLLAERGVIVTTIDGKDVATLSNVAISYNRTLDDLANSRWRDGRSDPDPSPEDSTDGDGTVLLASADDVGVKNIHLAGVKHEYLPAEGQGEVVQLLKGSTTADYVPAHIARAAIGVDIFSPVMPTIIGPNGEILSATENTFADAEFSWDPETPDHIKMLTILDPPAGTYRIILNGIDVGPFTMNISHAGDSAGITEEEFTGNATVGSANEYTFIVGEDGQSIDITTPNTPSAPSEPEGLPRAVSRGDEQDCCPGRDPEPTKPRGKVLGATTKKVITKYNVTLADLKPLNNTFFAVYHRLPSVTEWHYWANRYAMDKHDWKALQGAMYWHKARGRGH